MPKQKILIVDDEPSLVELVSDTLQAEGFDTVGAYSGEDALRIVEQQAPDLVVLDLNMPVMGGLEVCRRLSILYSIPIVILSVRSELSDKTECLNMGADDYVTKPFNIEELVSRIKAVLRRTHPDLFTSFQHVFKQDELEIDFLTRKVTLSGKRIPLTRLEFRLLQEFVINPGKTLSHDYLLQKVWGPPYQHENEYLHVYVGHLRSKIEPDPQHPKYIINVHGIGYLFDVSPV